jgi:hypothetical protein
MTRLSHDEIQLPGGIFMPSVASASTEQLHDCLEKDLESIASILQRNGSTTTQAGLASDEWLAEFDEKDRAQRGNNDYRVVKRVQRRIIAIRAELTQRKQRAMKESSDAKAAAQSKLANILAAAATQDARMREQAEMVKAAGERVQARVADVTLVAGTMRLAELHGGFCDAVKLAAEALGIEPPKFDPLPALPSRAEVQQWLYVLKGAPKGFDDLVQRLGDAGKVDRIIREYKR